jgi:hypothetical protein
MVDTTEGVSELQRTLGAVISKSTSDLSNGHLATSLYGLQGMTSDNPATRTLLLSVLSRTSKSARKEKLVIPYF